MLLNEHQRNWYSLSPPNRTARRQHEAGPIRSSSVAVERPQGPWHGVTLVTCVRHPPVRLSD